MIIKKFVGFAMLLFIFTASNAQATASAKKTTTHSGSTTASANFNGAWRIDDNKGFSVMHDGYFNAVAKDSSGKWDEVHAGTYTVNNDNTITFTVLYSSFPDHVGSANTAEYTMNGSTVKMRHFKKLIDAKGKDITTQMPKNAWETLTRAQ
jgi:hypothetical protein